MIHYIVGDATAPVGEGQKIIAHIVNDVGVWGAGFVMALSRKWKEPAVRYYHWARSVDFELGGVQYVYVDGNSYVANMCAQRGFGIADGPPIRYGALECCLHNVRYHADRYHASVHMPRIGCGLAGGTWDRVGPIVGKCLAGVEVYVYDLPVKG